MLKYDYLVSELITELGWPVIPIEGTCLKGEKNIFTTYVAVTGELFHII